MTAPDPPPTGRPGRLAAMAATASGYVVVLVSTLVLGVVATLFGWLPPRGHIMLRLARLWSRLILASTGVAIDASFETPIPATGGYVYLANHQSYFDIPALLLVLPGEIRFAAKRSLFLVPVFGWALYAGGFVPIDRKRRSQAKDAFAVAAARLREGCSMFFFPEGGRSMDGKLGAFERGGFLLALKSGLPIVPVGISGAREVMPRGRYSIRPGTIRVRVGEPIDPAAYGLRGKRQLFADVRERILELGGLENAGKAETAGEVSSGGQRS